MEFYIQTIDENLQQVRGFWYATGLDLNMGYMALFSDAAAWKILRVIMPFGLLKCLVLAQGIKPATNIFQAWITTLFVPMWEKASKHYLDDILCTPG